MTIEIYEAGAGVQTKPKADATAPIPTVAPKPTVAVFPVPDWWAAQGDRVRVTIERNNGHPVDSVTFVFKGERWTPEYPGCMEDK